MLVPGELVVKGAIDYAFQNLLAGNVPAYASDIFSMFSAAEQTKIQSWLTSTTFSPMIGYPQMPLKLPVIYVTSESEEEDISRQPIGGGFADVMYSNNGTPTYQQRFASYFRSVYSVHLMIDGQRELYWLQLLVKWALLASRFWMESNELLLNTNITSTGLLPVDESALKDVPVAYQRAILVTGDHVDSVTMPATTEVITSVSLTTTPVEYQFSV